jgi:phosphoesterase RecJ-like protein
MNQADKLKLYQEIETRLKTCKHVLLCSHVDPDGDTFGSAVAMNIALKSRGIESTLFCKSSLPETLTPFLKDHKMIHEVAPDDATYDCVMVFDCGDAKRVEHHLPIDLNIDHHLENKVPGKINLVDTDSAATGQVVYGLLKYLNIPMNPELATVLYLTMVADTGFFRWDNTSAEVLQMCSDLVAAGAKPYFVNQALNETATVDKLQLLGNCLANLKVVHNGNTVYSKAVVNEYNETAGFIDHIRRVSGTVVALMFVQVGSAVKVSFRSKSNDYQVQQVAKVFRGGGHAKAAGAHVPGTLDEVIPKVLSEIEKLYGAK